LSVISAVGAGADRPAEMGVAVADSSVVDFRTGDRQTAGAVDQDGIEGIADAATQRAEPVLPGNHAAGERAVSTGIAGICLDAVDERAVLQVVAGEGTAAPAIGVDIAGAAIERAPVVATEHTGIEAGPVGGRRILHRRGSRRFRRRLDGVGGKSGISGNHRQCDPAGHFHHFAHFILLQVP
jgi:hypothetical protein